MNLKKLMRNEKGAVLPLTALLIASVFLGFSALIVDVGMLYAERQQMVTAADAAALAGANILVESEGLNQAEAIASAIDIAKKNGADDVQIKTPLIDMIKRTVTVEVETTETLFFAKILGFTDANVSAKAVAKWDIELRFNEEIIDRYFLPFFVYEASYHLGEFYLHDNVGNGSWGMYEIPTSYNDALTGKEKIKLMENTIQETKGLRLGQYRDGIERRIEDALKITNLLERERYLQALVPIVDENFKIQAFGIYQIEGFISSGNKILLGTLTGEHLQVGTIIGRFIEDPILADKTVKVVYLIE